MRSSSDILRYLIAFSPLLLFAALVFFRRRRRRKQVQADVMPRAYVSYSGFLTPVSIPALRLTFAMLLALAGVYLCELEFPLSPGPDALTPSVMTLLALGGTSHNAVEKSGEWYRLFTAPLLHGGIIHLLFNGMALFYAGRVLENRIGRSWFLAIYCLGGLGGSLFSVVMHEGNLLSVGASGAIMGLFAAVMVVSFHATSEQVRQGLRHFSLRIVIPSLLPYASSVGLHVDYAAHIGGVIGGGIAAGLMLLCWPARESLPGFRKLAGLMAALVIGATGFAVSKVAEHYPLYVSMTHYRALCLQEMGGHSDAQFIREHSAAISQCIRERAVRGN